VQSRNRYARLTHPTFAPITEHLGRKSWNQHTTHSNACVIHIARFLRRLPDLGEPHTAMTCRLTHCSKVGTRSSMRTPAAIRTWMVELYATVPVVSPPSMAANQ